MGEPKAVLINAIVIGVVNVVLDPLLMFNCGLGVEGAAIATAVAQWVSSSARASRGACPMNFSPRVDPSVFRFLDSTNVIVCTVVRSTSTVQIQYITVQYSTRLTFRL